MLRHVLRAFHRVHPVRSLLGATRSLLVLVKRLNLVAWVVLAVIEVAVYIAVVSLVVARCHVVVRRVAAVHAERVVAILHVLRLNEHVRRVGRRVQHATCLVVVAANASCLVVMVAVIQRRRSVIGACRCVRHGAEVFHRVGHQTACGRSCLGHLLGRDLGIAAWL